jgi:hypothetical protein
MNKYKHGYCEEEDYQQGLVEGWDNCKKFVLEFLKAKNKKMIAYHSLTPIIKEIEKDNFGTIEI